jgi:thioredoxin 1
MYCKPILCKVAFVLICIFYVNISTTNAQSKLDADAFESVIKQTPAIQVVDVRTPQEFNNGHISNGLNLNINDTEFKAKLEELDKSKPVAVYCAGGVRSARAVSILQQLGFQMVYDLVGGITAWNGRGKVVVK